MNTFTPIAVFIVLLLFGWIGYICFKKVSRISEHKIRVVLDSADSDGFYHVLRVMELYKKSILGAEYNDNSDFSIIIDIIVKEEAFTALLSALQKIPETEVAELE